MAYQALYRKWRPATFSKIVGQEHITSTLRNEIKTGKISQAYLFCGSRGTGKTTTARVFSKAVNCLHPVDGDPCNECSVCRGIADGSLMDVTEIDAASNNGVENIRTINREVVYLPSGVTYKIYIIDEVHMLSESAFNALLKTLEEPPAHVIFILATTESHKIPATIQSRCQRFDFKRIGRDAMQDRLREVADRDGISVTDDALSLIMTAADGSMRDALSLLDQCASGASGTIDAQCAQRITGGTESGRMLQLGDAILRYDIEQVFLQTKQAQSAGIDAARLLEGLLEYFRDLILCKNSRAPAELVDLPAEELAVMQAQAQTVGIARCFAAMEVLKDAYDATRWAKNVRLILEMALIRLSYSGETSDAAPSKRIEQPAAKTPVTAPPVIETPVTKQPITETPVAEQPIINEPVAETPIAPKSGAALSEERITADWQEILTEIDRGGHSLLSGALSLAEFRVSGTKLYLMNLRSMMDTPETKRVVADAVRAICGVEAEVVIGQEPIRADSGQRSSKETVQADVVRRSNEENAQADGDRRSNEENAQVDGDRRSNEETAQVDGGRRSNEETAQADGGRRSNQKDPLEQFAELMSDQIQIIP